MAKPIDHRILICPNCTSDLQLEEAFIHCSSCESKHSYKEKTFHFSAIKKEEEAVDGLDKIKYRFKAFEKFYQFLVFLISPVYINQRGMRKLIRETFEENPRAVAMNLGSGNSDISPQVSNVDLIPYDNVDLTCDITQIPIKDNSVDLIVNIAVLEHVPYPEKVVSEILRILKPGGQIYCVMPFIQGFHASPYDFSRRTREGMKILFEDFEIIELKNMGGPTSGMLWIFQDWLATLLSFGVKPLHTFFYILLLLLTWPIKFLDLLLIHYPTAHHSSSGFTVIARKGESN